MDVEKIINTGLKKIKPYIPGTPIIEIARKYGIENPIKMNSNENPLGTSIKAVEKAEKSLKNINIYPDPESRKLRETLAVMHGVNAENVVVGSGGDELFYYIAMAFINDNDEAVIPEITFPIYETAVNVMRGRVVKSGMRGMKIDLEDILNRLSISTKLIFFCNPNNPTGDAISHDEFSSFIERVPEDVIVVVDEAYGDFNELDDFPRTVDLWKSGFRNIVLVKTLSKSHGFAGLRVGYAIMDEKIAELINRIRLPFNLTLISQEAAVEALRDKEFYTKTIDLVRRERKRYYSFFESLGLKYFKSHTNYILVDVMKDASEVTEELMKRGILVRNASSYGFPTFIRVTIGTEEQNDIFMKTFKDIVKKQLKL